VLLTEMYEGRRMWAAIFPPFVAIAVF